MTLIDQKTTYHSLNSALNPGLDLIDGRKEIDRLKFLTEYASLINFYDQENKVNGTWNPFLLKDPVFLLATIAKVNHTKIHDHYVTSSDNLKGLISKDSTHKNIPILFNQQIAQLINVFVKIERWSHFMNNYHQEYSLKKFVIHKLKVEYGSYFWAVIGLCKDLSSNKNIKGIQAIDPILFENFNKSVWRASKDPFWETLNLEMPLYLDGKSDKGESNHIETIPVKTKKSSIDVALSYSNGEIYFFEGSEYSRYIPRVGIPKDYPLPIKGNWRNFPKSFESNIDAAIMYSNESAYFFKGSQYVKYIPGEGVPEGYPLPIKGNWKNFPKSFESNIDAAIMYSNESVYFFKGSQYVKYIPEEGVPEGYPLPIKGNWRNLPKSFESNIDTAIMYSNESAYFFKGSQYVKYIPGEGVPEGYPKPIVGNWEGVFNVHITPKESDISRTLLKQEDATQKMLNKVSNSLVFVGGQLFSFLNDIINHASKEYDSLSVREGVFPDTALLRSFVKLQGIQQKQLNEISNKHLQFYFEDILKQKKKNAKPDRAFITAELAKKDNTFELAQGTLFNAGVDANKKPITFQSLKSTNLNPGSITGGFTLVQNKNPNNGLISLYKTPVVKPSLLKKDKTGKILGWETFGGNIEDSNIPESMGFAVASPMFYLKEGLRIITLKLTFKEAINQVLFNEANYFFSTEKEWLPLTQKPQEGLSNFTGANFWEILPSQEKSNELNLKIILGVTEKPVEKFIKNPDGYKSDWPIFKMEFNQFNQLENPPVISTINIQVDVSNLKSFSLSNDFGVLSTIKPYQLFGSAPSQNSSFFIGSEEIFSKPLSFLNVSLDWNALPSDFQSYYEAYNCNLNLNDDLESLTDRMAVLNVSLTKAESELNTAKITVASAIALAKVNTEIETLKADVVKDQATVATKKRLVTTTQEELDTANEALVQLEALTKTALLKDDEAKKELIQQKKIKGNWRNLPESFESDIDTAITFSNGSAYLFKGS
ncbi:MAG: hypothetical protein COB15_15420, partial [Flavobacteriales bacterium]